MKDRIIDPNISNEVSIFGVCDVPTELISNQFGNILPNFKLDVEENDNLILLKIKNIGYNGTGKIKLFFTLYTRNFKGQIETDNILVDSITLSSLNLQFPC